ncbi:hypothetical protein FA13DRAFT_1794880 [Coprinellus micaceus]|uniref:Uncharacterized protein n=1 Tax=Coprinellus micaceus TaxID=71717 RepID=A0A4Y7SZI5_COPMI|nr:hypothetical protein FA13DRAFT_1794880 [Coprinellus micaceus]
MQVNLSITIVSLVITLHSYSWPPALFVIDLAYLALSCPALQEFNVAFFSTCWGMFKSMEEVIQDAVGALHYFVNVPWVDIFPSLNTIRINEDVDIFELIDHPTLEFAKRKEWKLLLEDRFGDVTLVESA